MLRTAKSFEKALVRASDGDIGCLRDIRFEDEQWNVGSIAVELVGRRRKGVVLISTSAITPSGAESDEIAVDVTDQPESARRDLVSDPAKLPSLKTDGDPDLFYGWSPYWSAASPLESEGNTTESSASGLSGIIPFPTEMLHRGTEAQPTDRPSYSRGRSIREVVGYRIESLDGDLGHVGDFVIDVQRWSIPFLIVDMKNWWPGTHVLVPSKEILGVSRLDKVVFVSLTREVIQWSPEFDPATVISADYISRLDAYYNKHLIG